MNVWAWWVQRLDGQASTTQDCFLVTPKPDGPERTSFWRIGSGCYLAVKRLSSGEYVTRIDGLARRPRR